MAWGLNKDGFNRPNQNDIREDLDDKSRDAFGADVNLSNKSPNGILNGIFSWVLSKVWELAEKVYHSSHPSEAEGVQLDYLTPYFGTSRRRGLYAEGVVEITGTVGHIELYGKRYQTEDGVEYVLTEDVTIDNTGKGYGIVYCSVTGTIGNIGPNKLTVQSEPDPDVISITNPNAIDGGVDEETDEQLRDRLDNSRSSLGSGTVNSIISDLLDLSGVRAVRIDVNEEDTPQNGLPAHSIGVYTHGGNGIEITNSLMNNYTGIQFFGTTILPVKDLAGNLHDIGYSIATTVSIGADVKLTTDSHFSSNGIDAVKDAIIKVIGGTGVSGNSYNGLNMGDDVIYQQLIGAIMNIVGVTDVQLEIGEVGTIYGTSNVDIEGNKVAMTNVNDLTVVVL